MAPFQRTIQSLQLPRSPNQLLRERRMASQIRPQSAPTRDVTTNHRTRTLSTSFRNTASTREPGTEFVFPQTKKTSMFYRRTRLVPRSAMHCTELRPLSRGMCVLNRPYAIYLCFICSTACFSSGSAAFWYVFRCKIYCRGLAEGFNPLGWSF